MDAISLLGLLCQSAWTYKILINVLYEQTWEFPVNWHDFFVSVSYINSETDLYTCRDYNESGTGLLESPITWNYKDQDV